MTQAKRAHGVIFDMDGVLLDSEPLYTRATQQVIDPFGKIFDWSVKKDMIGRGALESAVHLINALDVPLEPEEYLRRREPLLEAMFPDTPAMPGAEALVLTLAGAGVPIAVATSTPHHQFLMKTRQHPWFASFNAVVCGDDPRVKRAKPQPDIFLVAASELGLEPGDCVVLEDSRAGLLAAKAAGMRVVAMPDPHLSLDLYREADHVIAGLREATWELLALEPARP